MKNRKRIDPTTGRQALSALIRSRAPLEAMSVLYARLGRLFQIPLPAFHPFVVGGPEANRKLLVTERGKVSWRTPDPVADLLQRGVLVTDGEEHDLYRGLIEPDLHPSMLPRYVEIMLAAADRVSAAWQDGQRLDMLVESRKIALLIIMEALFGVDIWEELPRLWKPILKAIEYISPGAWILWRRIPRPGYRRPLAQLDAYLYGIIRARRLGPPRQDLLQHLTDAGLEDARIRDQMLTMLIAGHDTSTALLAWTFHLLGSQPDVLEELVRQLDGSLAGQPPPSAGGWQPRLLDNVIKESLRLYPPIHTGNRTVLQDLSLEGGCVPAGERMFYSIYLTHRDPAHWPEPDAFRPARFSGAHKAPPFAYIPFGGGPRACIGAAFGQAEARLVLARLLQTHQFAPLAGRVHAHMGATLEPRPGVFMRVTRRRRAA
jgi:cytochrome P450